MAGIVILAGGVAGRPVREPLPSGLRDAGHCDEPLESGSHLHGINSPRRERLSDGQKQKVVWQRIEGRGMIAGDENDEWMRTSGRKEYQADSMNRQEGRESDSRQHGQARQEGRKIDSGKHGPVRRGKVAADSMAGKKKGRKSTADSIGRQEGGNRQQTVWGRQEGKGTDSRQHGQVRREGNQQQTA